MKRSVHNTYDTFRGSEAEIKARLRKYLQFFESCRHVLDIGCGRGEFLEILQERGIPALGIDADAEMVETCLQKGLKVRQGKAHAFLKKQGEAYDGIFCSQVIEHFTARNAADLLDLFRDSLEPGGKLVLVTLNPRNIRVVTNIFWMDLTHERLYPLKLLEQLLKERDFEIIASGDDLDTTQTGWLRRALRQIDMKLSRGTFFSGVDIFVAGEKRIERG